MDVSRLGVHESVATVFPPERLVAALGDVDAAVAVVGDDNAGRDVSDGVDRGVGDGVDRGVGDDGGRDVGDDGGRDVGDGVDKVVGDGVDKVVGDSAGRDVGDSVDKGVGDEGADGGVRDDSTDRGVDDCDAVVAFEHREAFLSGPAWVHSIQAGVDRFPLDAFERAGVALTNSTGIHAASVGETAVGYMVTLARRLHEYAAAQQRREWVAPAWDAAFTLRGETACVVGFGTVGRGVARRAAALGMSVTGVRRSAEPAPVADRVYGPGRLEAAVSGARFVVLAVPLTEETRGIVDGETLAAMRSDAYLVNVARGPVVDEDALVDALRDGEIAGAALDVFETEPLPEDSPLWGMDDVIVTPHRAAHDRDYFRDVAGIVRDNLRRIRSGAELTNRVV